MEFLHSHITAFAVCAGMLAFIYLALKFPSAIGSLLKLVGWFGLGAIVFAFLAPSHRKDNQEIADDLASYKQFAMDTYKKTGALPDTKAWEGFQHSHPGTLIATTTTAGEQITLITKKNRSERVSEKTLVWTLDTKTVPGKAYFACRTNMDVQAYDMSNIELFSGCQKL
ncbi:TPA: hypothetical protein ACK3Q6_002675 [Burkholderia cepacia]|uniref:hypothetical protein n=1 Tax=Burkholderia cepacia TaxID=292 RepID=UPI001CF1B2FC|nr:hypothetical protein [Burkholderia cepacia]MCA8361216.1 hypothetical protein [Burkholderia cepacia]HDR9764041.1 hypothetical protein [Burkholderia cepacia ATCC 25416]HDV6365627.1 hypothetical protein [Burkholderia cepacia]